MTPSKFQSDLEKLPDSTPQTTQPVKQESGDTLPESTIAYDERKPNTGEKPLESSGIGEMPAVINKVRDNNPKGTSSREYREDNKITGQTSPSIISTAEGRENTINAKIVPSSVKVQSCAKSGSSSADAFQGEKMIAQNISFMKHYKKATRKT